jgi:hypothetical protein
MKRLLFVTGCAVVAGAATTGAYIGLVTGRLTIDLGLGRRTRLLGPRHLDIAASRETVYAVAAAPYAAGRTPHDRRIRFDSCHRRDRHPRPTKPHGLPAAPRTRAPRHRDLHLRRDHRRHPAHLHRRAWHRPLASRPGLGQRGCPQLGASGLGLAGGDQDRERTPCSGAFGTTGTQNFPTR